MDYLIVAAAVAIALSIGANDIANAIGTTVGANILKYRKATILAAIAVAVGALAQGSSTTSTVGKGIVDISAIHPTVLGLSILCAALTVAVATFYRYPVSATQSVVGALSGAGLASGLEINYGVVADIAVVWIFLPVISAILSFVSYFIFKAVFTRVFAKTYFMYEKIIAVLVVVSGVAVAYSLGANNIGIVVGILGVKGALETNQWVIVGAAFVAVGALFFSRRVVLTIGKGITTLDPLRAFVSQFSSAVAVIGCTFIGIPVSLSQAAVGSVIGVGLTKGRRSVKKRFIVTIMLSWILTPLVSGLLSFGIYHLYM